MNAIVAHVRAEGFVTTKQAFRLGGTASMLHRLVSSGRLVNPVRSVYLLPSDDPAPATREERLALLTRGLLSEHAAWVASHHCSLVLQGIPVWDVPHDQVHAAGPQRNSVRRRSLHLHVLRDGDPVVLVDGYPCLAPEFAVLQVAARFGVPAGLVAADAGLRAEKVTRGELERWGSSGRFGPGVGAVRSVIAAADPRAESPMESLLRLHLSAGGWPLEPQANVGGPGDGYRVDVLVDGRVVVEYDGEDKYAGSDGQRVVLAEKSREDWLRSRGYGFVRVTKRHLGYPTALRIAVGQALKEHRRLHPVPPGRRKEPR